ncbi:SOSS complex subunit B1-like [Oopsacas minuta]|uniref:SOSS complex subunit B1-like n=1 Tax=Oopsacas minuta TaxID=111878 RepID=A0AAV7JS70_9METZ|nr:SOSS complex subunit B1-like [Oopsacas minuta]
MAESEKITKIVDLMPGMSRICCKFIVLEVNNGITTRDGHIITTCRVADRTASINLSVWDDKGKAIKSGDILKLNKGYINLWKNVLTLYTGKAGQLTRVGDFAFLFSEHPFLSEHGRYAPDSAIRYSDPPNDGSERMVPHEMSPLYPNSSEITFPNSYEPNGHTITPEIPLTMPYNLHTEWRYQSNMRLPVPPNNFSQVQMHPLVTPTSHMQMKPFTVSPGAKPSNGTFENEKQTKKF